MEARTLTRSGGYAVWEVTLTPLAQNGQIVSILGIVREITERQQAEDALRASEERYRTLAEAARDTIFVLDRDERFQYFNSFAARQFGKRPDELIGQPLAALFPPEVYEPRKRSLQEVFETGEPVYTEVRTPLPGREAWSGTWLAPIKNAAGEVHAVLGIARDITERVQRERELEAIAAVSAALRTARTRAEMLPIILDQLVSLLDASAA
ncbi:MAG: PAS domain S-box protein, partial [candidate division NC10 bacterium]|nr:PAS domain S-box protein [candidate division NC10 bacterium]